MKPEKLKKILKKNKKDWEELADKFSQTRHHLWSELEDLSQYVKDGDKILDLGCGNGRLYRVFENREVEYIGVDQSEKLIELAKKQFNKPKFIVGDALNLETKFPKNEFNVIFAIAFLHHLPLKKLRLKVLKDCYSILKPNGFLICTVWNLYQPRLVRKYKIWQILLGFKDVFIPFKLKNREVRRYYHAFTMSEIERSIKRADFQIIDKYYTKGNQKANWLKGFNLIVIAKKK